MVVVTKQPRPFSAACGWRRQLGDEGLALAAEGREMREHGDTESRRVASCCTAGEEREGGEGGREGGDGGRVGREGERESYSYM